MAAKTLSTSTLSLKFMQNAHRAKNLAEVQLEKAAVKDDGEWEVAQEIRDAWGPETAQAVSYEASYLPFLFSTDAPTPTAAKGRRAFKRGTEVADEYQPVVPAPAPQAASTSKSTGKLKSISSTLSGRPAPKKNANANRGPKGKTARQAVYDSTGVGADLRAEKTDLAQTNNTAKTTPTPQPPPPNVFLKPVGVDEPAPHPVKISEDSPDRKSKGKRAREESDSGKTKKKKKKGEQTD